MPFCGKCGTPLGNEKFCPNCGAANESKSNIVVGYAPTMPASKPRGKKKGLFAGLGIAVVGLVVVGFVLTRAFGNVVNEPCDWCGNRPSVAYETHDGSFAYVCKDCSENCAFCGEKATQHYENLLGTMVFVCDDCYEDIR